jgi:NAD(P)H-hydrate epimerase
VQPVLTAQQMAALDRYTIEQLGVESRILMSNAARASLAAVRQLWPQAARLLILCGPGNNGGDGIALGYYAQQAGLDPVLALCSKEAYKPSEDGQYFLDICRKAGLPLLHLHEASQLAGAAADTQAELCVDALFGTGLSKSLEGFYRELIEAQHELAIETLAIDCPSGLDCTTGLPLGTAVRANATVSFGFAKRGFYHPAAINYTGELYIADIGLAGIEQSDTETGGYAMPDALWDELREPRLPDTHKGDYGRVLIVAGHARYPGAPRLAARAALRSGAGLVRLYVPQYIHSVCSEDPAVMVAPHNSDGSGGFAAEPDDALLEDLAWADALVIGPGLGSGAAVALAHKLIARADIPVVVDADGLRALPLERQSSWPLLLTPHAGELARLLDESPESTTAHWFEAAIRCAAQHNAFVLAKSSQSLLALPDGMLLFPRRGHPALATGGTGDVLSGILGALLARLHAGAERGKQAGAASRASALISLPEVIISAANLHAQAGRIGAERLGENGLTATDLPDLIPEALQTFPSG